MKRSLTHLTDGCFALVQVFSEPLKLQLSLPQFVLQVSDDGLVGLDGRRGQRVGQQRARALAGRGAAAVGVGVSVMFAGLALALALALARSVIRRQVG